MSEFVMTAILWAFITLGNPPYETVQVIDEFPTTDICAGVAGALATEVQKDMNEKKIVNVEVTLACIPILEIKDPQNLNGSGLIKPKPNTKNKKEQIG